MPGGSGVHGGDAAAGRDERQIAEVAAPGDLDTGFRAEDPGRGEAEPVPGGRPEAAGHQLRACRGRAGPRLALGLGGLVMLAQHGTGSGETMARAAPRPAGRRQASLRYSPGGAGQQLAAAGLPGR